jgi:hypothetical protein
VGRDNGSGHRWQGYSHQELYDMLHAGPGSAAAGTVADRWSAMAGALADIQQEIAAGVTAAGATWDGSAADSARSAIGPLGEWAQQASTAADVMRISTELQGDLLAKARADMPVPVAVPPQPGPVGRLVTAQVDFEVAELASQVAEQQAHQVMAQYEAATGDNTSTLGDFGEPPTLVVDTTPITGPVVRGSVHVPETGRSLVRGRGRVASGTTQATERTGGAGARGAAARRTTTSGGAAPTEEPGVAEDGTVTAAPGESTPPGTVSPSTAPSSTAPSGATPSDATPPGVTRSGGAGGSGSTVRSAAAGVSAGTTTAGTTTPSSQVGPARSGSRDSNDESSAPTAQVQQGQQGQRFTGAVVPAARRPDQRDEPDDLTHESKYLLEADDIYGHQTYSPPVIGESPRRR